MSFAVVALGGALGSMGRYGVSLLAAALLGTAYPWGTLAVNILGSAAIGALAAQGIEGNARLFWVTGVLGGFTTFSAFSLEAALLWERAAWLGALYVVASVGLGVLGFALGWWMARRPRPFAAARRRAMLAPPGLPAGWARQGRKRAVRAARPEPGVTFSWPCGIATAIGGESSTGPRPGEGKLGRVQ